MARQTAQVAKSQYMRTAKISPALTSNCKQTHNSLFQTSVTSIARCSSKFYCEQSPGGVSSLIFLPLHRAIALKLTSCVLHLPPLLPRSVPFPPLTSTIGSPRPPQMGDWMLKFPTNVEHTSLTIDPLGLHFRYGILPQTDGPTPLICI